MDLHPFGQAWRARDLDRVLSMLSDDVIFHSPFVSEPAFEGRDAVAVIFAIAFQALEGDRYTHDFGDVRSRILVADSRVAGEPVKSTTVLELDAEGKVNEIWMMIRPVTGLALLAQAVGEAIHEREPAVLELSTSLVGLAEVIDRTAAGLVGVLNNTTARRS